jgi:hypothetical protein
LPSSRRLAHQELLEQQGPASKPLGLGAWQHRQELVA